MENNTTQPCDHKWVHLRKTDTYEQGYRRWFWDDVFFCEKCLQQQTVTNRAWLAARDAQQRREGAIEALEGIAKDHGIDGGKAYIAKVVYREFPDLLHMSVGVVDAADLMQAAKRLREGGE